MKRLAAVLVAILAAPLHAATVSGTVKDAATGAALGSITVDAYSSAGTVAARTTSSASGAYSMALPAGSYRLLAYDMTGTWATSFHQDAESFDTSTIVALTSAQSVTVHFLLHRAGVLSGYVRSLWQVPLQGMTVAVYNSSGTLRGRTTTDASGAYRLSVPSGSYRVAAWDEALEYLPRFNGNVRSFTAATPLSVTSGASTGTDLALPPASSLSGRVVDAATGAPLAAATAEAWDWFGFYAGRASTDATGAYRLPLESGFYRVVFYDPSATYAPAYLDGATSLETSRLQALALGESRTRIDGALERAAHVSGTVRDALTGSPRSAISVVAWNADGTARTSVRSSPGGEYRLAVPSGTYVIGTYDESLIYLPQYSGLSSSFDSAVPLVVIGGDSSAVDFDLVQGARVVGTVRSASSGNSLSRMTVGAYDAEGTLVASTDSATDGAYALLVPPGAYHLAVSDPRSVYQTVVDEQTLTIGETVTKDFELAPAERRRRSSRQ